MGSSNSLGSSSDRDMQSGIGVCSIAESLDSLVKSPLQQTVLSRPCFHDSGDAAARTLANDKEVTPLIVSPAFSSWYSIPNQGSQTSYFLASGACPSPNQKKYTSSGLSSSNTIGLRLDTAICHNLKPCSTQAEKFEVQLSETCQKRFIMFDHSGNTKRMIFHPAMMNEFPNLLCSNPNELGCYLNCLQNVSFRAVSRLQEAMTNSPHAPEVAPWGARLPCIWKDELASQGLLGMGCKSGPKPSGMIEGNVSTPIHIEAGENDYDVRSSYTHEDTEDIDALLSSEDEVSSTGHSPSDLTWNVSQSSSQKDDPSRSSVAGTGKKRKCVVTDCSSEDEDDADSAAATSVSSSLKELLGSFSDVSQVNEFNSASQADDEFRSALQNQGWESGYGKEELLPFYLGSLDEVSSSSSANKQRHCRKPVKRSRKQKIKSTFQLLRGIIPGGESMDTAIVLDEAIQFVKSLQVKVQTLEARNVVT